MRPRRLPRGHRLIIALTAPARVHWGTDGWNNVQDVDTHDTGLGVHVARLDVAEFAAGRSLQFTFEWLEKKGWEGKDYEMRVEAGREE